MARSDPDAERDFDSQKAVWLAEALERLPIAIGLIDAQGNYFALSGALKDLLGPVIPSRNPEMKRLWKVTDDNGNAVDPVNWPSERTLRGDSVMNGLDGVYLEGTENERRLRLFSTPFVDSTGRARGLVLMFDNELERRAQEHKFERTQQHFVDTLVDTIRQAAAQQEGDPAEAHRIIAKRMGFSGADPAQRVDRLSRREEEVLRLMAWGNSRKEIGTQLGIAVKTVEFHRSSAARKLDLKSRVDVVRYALDRGWLRDAD